MRYFPQMVVRRPRNVRNSPTGWAFGHSQDIFVKMVISDRTKSYKLYQIWYNLYEIVDDALLISKPSTQINYALTVINLRLTPSINPLIFWARDLLETQMHTVYDIHVCSYAVARIKSSSSHLKFACHPPPRPPVIIKPGRGLTFWEVTWLYFRCHRWWEREGLNIKNLQGRI